MAEERQSHHEEGHQERHERVHQELESARIQRLEEAKRDSAKEQDDSELRVEKAREAILGPKKAEHEKSEELEQQVEHESAKEKAETPKTDEQILEEPKISRPMLSPKLNYTHTMNTLRHQLEPMSRNFSKFIHTPIVEKTSEMLENTVARPSVAVGATWTALIVGSTFYLVARHYGYQLSGSELIFSFIVGAFVGLLIEGLVFMFRRRP
jgi:hypothetical protein